jgi:hypothetical protein
MFMPEVPLITPPGGIHGFSVVREWTDDWRSRRFGGQG